MLHSVTFGDLASLRAHLEAKPGDSEEVQAMKASVNDSRLIMEAKETVTYLKASKKVIQECDTRWNSLHTMLVASALEMFAPSRYYPAPRPRRARAAPVPSVP